VDTNLSTLGSDVHLSRWLRWTSLPRGW